jgi:hypothetical protein
MWNPQSGYNGEFVAIVVIVTWRHNRLEYVFPVNRYVHFDLNATTVADKPTLGLFSSSSPVSFLYHESLILSGPIREAK